MSEETRSRFSIWMNHEELQSFKLMIAEKRGLSGDECSSIISAGESGSTDFDTLFYFDESPNLEIAVNELIGLYDIQEHDEYSDRVYKEIA